LKGLFSKFLLLNIFKDFKIMLYFRERREEKEKLIKLEKDSKEMIEKERARQELLEKEEKERKQREAVQQHFEESLRLAHQKVCNSTIIASFLRLKTFFFNYL